MARWRSWACLCLLLISLMQAGQARADDRPTIVAVNYPLAFFAGRLAGDSVNVLYPVPDGRDPAFWRPSIEEISRFQAADLILLNGAGFAAWTAKTSLPRARLVDTSRAFADTFIETETVTHSHGPEGEHSHTGTASYTWLDQQQAILQAQAVADSLIRLLPELAGSIEQRMGDLRLELARLDEAALGVAARAAGVSVITSHPRYQYFARAYGFRMQSLAWEAGEMPGADQMAELEQLIAAAGPAVLLWEAAPPDAARQAVAALGIRDVVFPTLAARPATGDYVIRFEQALRDLEAALSELQAP